MLCRGLRCCGSSAARLEFAQIDEDGSGALSTRELAKYIDGKAELWAMLSVNLDIDEVECRRIATQVAVRLARGGAALAPMAHREMFDAIDEDSSDTLDKAEVRQLVGQVFPGPVSDAALDAAFATMDGDGDGEVCFEEFEACASPPGPAPKSDSTQPC